MKSNLTLDTSRDFGVVGFGTNAVDFLITVPFYPEFDSKVRLNSYERAAGGEVASTLTGLQRLGIKTAYIGRFGSDAEGKYGLASLEEEGVDVRNAQIVDDAKTQIAFILIDAQSGERTVIWDRDQKLAYSATEVPTNLVSKASIFHCTPHDVAACMELAAEAKMHGTKVSIDIDNLFDGVERFLPNVDILIASRDLPEKLTGINDEEDSLRAIRDRYGCAIVGITLGAEGCLLISDDGLLRVDGYPVPGVCRDTTGAGDAFRAGLLFGLLRDRSLEDSAKIANAVASLKCRELGARTALPTIAEVETLTGLKLNQ